MEKISSFFRESIAKSVDSHAWPSAMANWLLELYVLFLPQEIGGRLLEEWQAMLDDIPCNGRKLLEAISLGLTLVFTRKEAEGLEKSLITANASIKPHLVYVLARFLITVRDWTYRENLTVIKKLRYELQETLKTPPIS